MCVLMILLFKSLIFLTSNVFPFFNQRHSSLILNLFPRKKNLNLIVAVGIPFLIATMSLREWPFGTIMCKVWNCIVLWKYVFYNLLFNTVTKQFLLLHNSIFNFRKKHAFQYILFNFWFTTSLDLGIIFGLFLNIKDFCPQESWCVLIFKTCFYYIFSLTIFIHRNNFNNKLNFSLTLYLTMSWSD